MGAVIQRATPHPGDPFRLQLLLPELTQPEVVLLLTSISLPLLRPEALVALLPRLESETLAHQFHARVHVCVSTWVDRHVSALTAEEGDGSEGSQDIPSCTI